MNKQMKQKITTLIIGLMVSATIFAGPTEDMHDALLNGDYAKFKAALSAGADVNSFNKYGNTPLLQAVVFPDMVKDLIAAKADINKFNQGGSQNPLTVSCFFGLTETVKILLDAGADVNAADPMLGQTPLFFAMWGGLDKTSINSLIDKGANAQHITKGEQNLIDYFALFAQTPEMRVLKMKEIANFYKSSGLKIHPVFENPELGKWSTLEDRLDIILSLGFTIDQEAQQQVAATTPNAAEINKNLKKMNMKTWPMLSAMMNLSNRSAMIKALANKGADAKKIYDPGLTGVNRTLIHILALRANTANPADDADAVDALVKAGCDIKAMDNLDFTPLMYAAKFGNASVAKALLKYDCNINAYSKEKKQESQDFYMGTITTTYKITYLTALNWAEEANYPEIVKAIKAAGGKGTKELKVK